MNPYESIKSFDYFIGKVCSIHTVQSNWKLQPEQILDYYTGIVNSVNECGVCITNPINHKKTFIMTPAIVAIAEETVMEKEEFDQSFKEYQDKKKEIFGNNPTLFPPKPETPTQKPITKINDHPFVDIESITKFARAAKEKTK